ncbi:hypothetical protein RclHR1_07620007 [Rhizophagus clarus]|uniref:F-box domain-containing protein n=1 Tax=Rhizophagus clarus TaxID=94130 RepID=A0A2Z6SLU1_9GLOM|nr:hypothetical protein RclHR1_07620007 [Rhizophagus clarus]GES93577.1 hypothetical protein GLOIN_2v1691443 [Rhizophagus clarus]
MTIGLISDCLGEIFKCFPDDNNTLYQCMLVNRMWCESAVQVLWKDPLAMLIKKTDALSLYDNNVETEKEEREQALGFLRAFLNQLPEESRSLLIRNGIKLPKLDTKKSMFNYLEFINTFDIVRFSLAVSFWLFRGGKYSGKTRFQCYLMEQEIYRVVVNKCPHITKIRCIEDLLDMDTEQLPVFNFTYLITSPNNNLFSNIREFECSAGFTTDQLFFVLSQLITNLDTLKIQSAPEYFDGYGLSEFIKTQQSLRCVEFICNDKDDDELIYECKEIGRALEKQAKSLTKLRIFGFQGVPFDTFRNCENLEELSLYFVDDMPHDIEEKLTSFKFRKLTKLYVKAASLDLGKISKFIRHNGGKLTDIKLEIENIVDNEQSGLILEAVANNCPNLISFQSSIDPANQSQLHSFCKRCKKLVSLRLNLVEDKFDACDTYDILNILGEHAPRNIFYFILEGDWELLKCTLENFLKQRQSIAPFKVIYVGIIGRLKKSDDCDSFDVENFDSDYEGSDYSDSQYGYQRHFNDLDFYHHNKFKDSNSELDFVTKSCDYYYDLDADSDPDMNCLTKYIEEGILEIRSPLLKDSEFGFNLLI